MSQSRSATFLTTRSAMLAARSADAARLRLALHDLAATRCNGTLADQQRSENIVVSLLWPTMLVAANAGTAGRLDPDELVRVTSALLTAAVRSGDPSRGSFADVVVEQVLARMADRQQDSPATWVPALPAQHSRRHAS